MPRISRRVQTMVGLWIWTLVVLFALVQAFTPLPAAALTPTVTPNLNLPDLVISNMRIELETGGSCSYSSTALGLRVTVRNQWGTTAGAFEVEANGVRKPVAAGLAPGATTTLWFSGYRYGSPNVATADVANVVVESNESNNTLSQMVPIPTLPPTCTPTRTPTITPTRTPTATVTPGTVESFRATAVPSLVELTVGQTLVVTGTVYNEGVGVSFGLPQYRLRVETAPGVEQDQTNPIFTPARPDPVTHYLGLNPGGSDSATFTLQAARPGSVTFALSVSGEVCILGSPGCAGGHWSMASGRSVTVVVRDATTTVVPSQPDLLIQSMWISVERMDGCNYTLPLGVHATVKNQGAAAAGAFEVAVNGVRKTVSAGLAAGQTTTLWFSGYQTGVNSATADPGNLVAESDETNNTLAQQLPVPSLPVPCTATPTVTATPVHNPPTASVSASLQTVWVGSTLTVQATSNLSLVGYTLTVIDNSTGQEQDQSNPIITPARPGTLTVSSGAVNWTLTAARPGSVTFRVNAYGEIKDPACGGCWHFVSVNASSSPVTAVDGPTVTASPTATPTPRITITPTIVGDMGWRTITGRVSYQSYDMIIPLAGATVTCSHFSYVPRTICNGTTTTAADGSFSFGSVLLRDTDTINIQASAPGYVSQTIQRNGVATYSNPVFSFILQPNTTPTATPTSTPSASTCSVTYRVSSQWADGFVADVTIKNTGTTSINNWKLDWSFANGQQITNMWNATPTQSGANVSALNAGWNSMIAPGGTVSFGFQATQSGTNTNPTSFTLNGNRCS